jgi:SAM-dependent methyltransferase
MKEKNLQRDVFSDSEGNNFFFRNEKELAKPNLARDMTVERISHHLVGMETCRVLEVGCASGENLNALNSVIPIQGFGIEPSSDAIRAGQLAFPNLNLKIGTADVLPFDDGFMDVIWYGFCLYLIDRVFLHRVVAEADRVLKDGGLIVIHDFDPGAPSVRPYRHYPGVNSYKMDYSAFFLCDPAYSLVEKLSLTHLDAHWSADAQQRLGLWFCRKNVQLGYRPG